MSEKGRLPAEGRVFLTGGTGLVGSHVAELLIRGGYRVRALHRAGSDTTHLSTLKCDLLEGELPARASELGEAMAGCHAVVHAAAVLYRGRSWPEIRAVNVTGAEEVFRGAAQAGIRRGVHLSSVAVYGDPGGRSGDPGGANGYPGRRLGGGVLEDASAEGPLRPREHYARSKREAEQAVSRVAEETGLRVALLRASAVFGERDRLFTPRVLEALRLPLHLLPGGGRTPLPLVYAGNLAVAVLAALRRELPLGARGYNVSGDFPVTQRELLSAFAAELGRPFRPVSVPAAVVLAGARLGEALGIRVPGAEELSLRRVARLSLTPDPFTSSRIREELGWEPEVGVEEAIRRTARWVAEGGRAGESRPVAES